MEQGDTEGSVDFLPLWKGELITDLVLGKLNSVNTMSQVLSHIIFPVLEERDLERWSC